MSMVLLDKEVFWPPADELLEAAERIRRRLGEWPAGSKAWRICLSEPDHPRSGDLIVGNDGQGRGGESFEAPTYACRPPGVHHGPFKSDRGCLLYEIHYYDESKK